MDIIFRGKDIDTNKWVYGSLITKGDVHLISEWDLENWRSWRFVVEPMSVSQFVGRTDRNGEKVFLGDVIETVFLFEIERYVVCYLPELDGVVLKHHPSDDGFLRFLDVKDFKVIGNIVDNPELLVGTPESKRTRHIRE